MTTRSAVARVPRLLIASALLVLSSMPLLLSTPNASAQSTSAPATTVLALAQQTPFVGPQGTFRVELATRQLPAGSSLSLTVYSQVSSRARLERTMAGEQLGTPITTTPSIAVASGAASTTVVLPLSATWPAPTDGAVLSNAGVYPVTIDAKRADGTRIDRLVTQLVRLPAVDTATDALEVGTIVRIDAVPAVDDDGVATLSDADTTTTRERLAIIDDPSIAPPLTLSASPFVLSTLREGGATIATTSPTRQTASHPWVSIDASSFAAAQQDGVVVDETRVGDATLANLFGIAPDRRTAIIDPTTSAHVLDLDALRGTTSVVLDAAQIRAALVNNESSVLTQQFVIISEHGASFAAIASDDTAIAPLATTADPVLAAHRTIAELAMLHFEQPTAGRGVALALPAAIDPVALRTLLTALTQRTGATSGGIGAAVIAPVTLADLFASTSVATDRSRPVVREWTSTEAVELGDWNGALDQARWDLGGLQAMLPDAPDLTDPIARSILTSAARDLPATDRLAILGTAQGALHELAGSVSGPFTQRVTLTSQSGDIPLTFENSLSTDAHVRVTVSSPKLDFPDGSTLDLVLPAGTTRTTVRVSSRASGAFPMEVSIASVDGVLPISTSRVDVRSTAISGWGLVLSIGAGLFLAVWWLRHFRHTRRARSLVSSDDAEPRSTTAR